MTLRQASRLVLIGLGTSVVPLDTAVNIAFPDITTSFGLPLAMIQWVVICYVLTYASLMLAFGRVGDIFSHAGVFRAGLAWSVAAFLLCAAAPSYGWLLFFRFLQGIGAGLVISCAPALVTGLFAEHRRSRAVAIFTMMFALGSASGPLIGGMLVQHWGWPAVFWFRAPIALVALLFLGGLPASMRATARQSLDVVGAFLLALGLSTLLLALNQLQHLGQRLALALPLTAVALSGLFGFGHWERRVAAPIVDLEFFRSGSFALINLASVLISLSGFSVLLIVPYYFVRFTGMSLPLAGAVLASSFGATILASPLAGSMLARLPAERVAGFGAVLCGTGLLMIGGWGAAAPALAAIVTALLLQGFGTGLFQVAYMDVVMRTLPRQQRGVAGSLATLTRTIGTVTGATALTLIFHAFEASALAAAQTAAASFLAAFGATFRIAGMVAATVGVLTAFVIRIKS